MPLSRRVAAVMNRAKRRQIHRLRDLVQAHAPVVVLEVEKILRIESAGGIDRLALDQHAAARHHRKSQHRLVARRIDVVAKLIAIEPPLEKPPHEARRESAQQEVEDRRIAFAQEIGRAVGSRDRWRRRADVRMRVEPAHGVGDAVARDLDIGIQHELVVGARAVQHQVVGDAVANVEMPVQVRDLNPRIGEPRLPEPYDFVGNDAVFAVVDQRDGHAASRSRLRGRRRSRVQACAGSVRAAPYPGRNVTTLTVSDEGSTGRDSETAAAASGAGSAPRCVG